MTAQVGAAAFVAGIMALWEEQLSWHTNHAAVRRLFQQSRQNSEATIAHV